MKNKTLTFSFAFLFSLVLLVGLVSADMTFNPTSLSKTGEQGSTQTISFTINNTNVTTNMTNITSYTANLTSGSNIFPKANLAISSLASTLAANGTDSVTLTATIASGQATGTYTGNLTFSGNYSTPTNYTLPVSITVTEPEEPEEIIECEATGDSDNDLSISLDFSVSGYGDDEEWYAFDEIEVEVEVENRNDDYDLEDLKIEWGLYDKESDKWYIDDSESKFDLKDGDEETKTLTFKLDDDIDDLEDGDYVFYVWASGELDDDNNTEICDYASEDITIEVEDDFVVVDGYPVTKEVTCGESFSLNLDVWNIGSDDQDDVEVVIYNHDLGISEVFDFDEIEAFESEDLSVTLKIPSDASEKSYLLKMEVRDEDGDVYENSDDDETVFTTLLKVTSCSVEDNTGSVSVSANLQSGGQAGEELIVKTTITNTDSKSKIYTFQLDGFDSWATLKDISPALATIPAGQSQEVVLTFDLSEGVSGKKSFTMNTYSGSEIISSQPLSVNVEDSKLSFSKLMSGDSTWVWAIGAVNLVLIILIIFAVVKLLRR